MTFVKEEKILKEYDPIERKNCSSSVLLIHGDSDKNIPIEGQKDYYRYLRKNKKEVM
jgi:dipeptidyl aminopeptidase/acylaminoacyl peptidase